MNKKSLSFVTVGTAVVVFLVLMGIRSWRLDRAAGDEPVMDNGLLAEWEEQDGLHYSVPPEEVYSTGLAPEQVPPLNDPEFVTVAEADLQLADELYGIDVEVDGKHRFYPYQVLNWHEIVNDTFGDKNLAVTYDPLAGSAVVFERGETEFYYSGKVYNNNLLMDDGAGNLWLQLRGECVVGATDVIGLNLYQYPSQSMTWSVWKEAYADGEVLSFQTNTGKDYRMYPYGTYVTAKSIYFPINHSDDRLSVKDSIDGVVVGSEQVAFPQSIMKEQYLLSATVAERPVVAFYDETQGVTNIFDARVGVSGDKTLTFVYNQESGVWRDNETESTWDAQGRAYKGELRGTQLSLVNAPEAYWFAWAAIFPNVTLAGEEFVKEEEKDITVIDLGNID